MLLLSESSAATLPGDPDVADDNDDQRGREPGKDHHPGGLGTVTAHGLEWAGPK